MPNNELDQTSEKTNGGSKGHGGIIAGLVVVLLISLGGNAYLLNRSNNLSDQIAQLQDDTKSQISKLADATNTLLDQRMQTITDELKAAHDSADTAVKRVRAEAQKQSAKFNEELEDQQKQIGGELTDLKDIANNAASKITEVSGDVSSVKTDVTSVKTDVASQKSQLDQHSADLKRMTGDMGVMSGLIATNAKDLQALRDLGERNYVEFDLNKATQTKKIGDVTLTLKKADPKRNRFTMAVLADDRLVEKKDRTINEPVQVYVSDNRSPYEIVVNQIKKDEVVGYLSTPKVKATRTIASNK